MIARFKSNIKIESHFPNIMKSTVHRNYSVEQGGNTIATGWVKDLSDYHSLTGFKNSFNTKIVDRNGSFSFKGKEYHIGKNVRWGSEWPFYDSCGNHVMSIWEDNDKLQVETKKLFSKNTILKQRTIESQKIITNKNNEYKMYSRISLGKEGEYYVLYKDGSVVSTICVHTKLHNYGPTMDLYIEEDSEIILVTMLYCFMLVMYNFYHTNTTIIQENGNIEEIRPKSKDYELAKIDWNFIEGIKHEETK